MADDSKPSAPRLAMSRSIRLRALARKYQRAWDRHSKALDSVKAEEARRDMNACDAGADMLRDWAIVEAKRTGETLQ